MESTTIIRKEPPPATAGKRSLPPRDTLQPPPEYLESPPPGTWLLLTYVSLQPSAKLLIPGKCHAGESLGHGGNPWNEEVSSGSAPVLS